MSFSAGATPRRLAQPHGSYFNAVLSPNIALTRKNGGRYHSASGGIKPVQMNPLASTNVSKQSEINRLNENIAFTANDEVFDARAGEVLVSSHTESGFSPHGRGFVFSSLNGYTSVLGESDPREALYKSDIRFVGLCQSDFVSANTALQEQGLAVQSSGVKTILNDCGQTIHMGDKLMLDVPDPLIGMHKKQRKGIPNEKVRFVLRPVPENFMTTVLEDRVIEALAAVPDISIEETDVIKAIPYIIAAYRKQARLVVAQAVSSARPDHQVDVKLVPPSFV